MYGAVCHTQCMSLYSASAPFLWLWPRLWAADAFYAHNLMLWDAFPPPPQATGNLKGDSKASQMVLRWDLDNPLPLPAPAHAPAPASAPTPEEASPAPQEASSSSTFHKPKK